MNYDCAILCEHKKNVDDGSLIFNNLIWLFTIQTYSHSNASSCKKKRKPLMNVFFCAINMDGVIAFRNNGVIFILNERAITHSKKDN